MRILKRACVLQHVLLAITIGFAAESAAQFQVVKTGIEVVYKGRIEVSDKMIAYGTGMVKGVDYIRPGDTKGRGIPGSDQFSSSFFCVAGEKIVVANPNEFTVSVFDTAAGKMTNIPVDELKLYRVSGSMYDGGSIQCSGNYAVVITDTSGKDMAAFKVLDLTGAEPRIIPFKGRGQAFSRQILVTQVAVDDKSGHAAAATPTYDIVLFNFKKPEEEPRVLFFESVKGVGKAQMRFDDGRILFHSGEAYPRAILTDIESGEPVELTRAIHSSALRADTYVYFADRDSKDTLGIVARAAVGKISEKPVFVTGEAKVDGATANNGYIGFGSSVAVTPDGKQIFVAGRDDIGRTERLQAYRAGKFALVPDASVRPAFLQASDVIASSSIVAFKVGVDNRTTLAYIKLK
jgi:hypothetical protein